MTDGDFYEDDEPVEKVAAAFEAGEKGLTKPHQKWSVHVCLLDKHCRENTALLDSKPVNRVHLNTPWFHFGVALVKHSQFAGRIDEAGRINAKGRWFDFRRYPNRQGSP